MLTQPEQGTIDMARHCFREDDVVSQFLLEHSDAASLVGGRADHREVKPFTEADVAKEEDLSLVDGSSCPRRMPQVAMGQIRRRAIVQSFNLSNAHQA